jgi:hypothetical protein
VRSGYQLLYDGDKAGAQRHFQALLDAHPEDLAARFGVLTTEHDRLDDEDTSRTTAFERELDAFIAAADQRYSHSQRDQDALFYRAAGHMLRALYKFENDEGMVSAARDAAHAKGDIEMYLKTHPDDGDAYLILGSYNYYTSLAPGYARVLGFLLFLPSGNRTLGLQQLERAAAHGRLFGTEAELVLLDVYSSLEFRPKDAMAIADKLQREHPNNDDVGFALADLHLSPAFEARDKAAATYEAIITRRQHDESTDGAGARYRALLGLAATQFGEWRCDDAIATLTPTIDAAPRTPDWVLPQFLLARANDRLLLNEASGQEDLQRVLRDARLAKWNKDATALATAMARRSPGEAAMYTSLVPANRLVAEGKWDAAREAYAALAKDHPQDAQIRYRQAYLDFASGAADEARPILAAVAATKTAPAWVRAWSLLYEGRVDDLAGRRDAARKEYQSVVDNYDKQGAADAAHIGLVTPYHRPAKDTAGTGGSRHPAG